VTHSSEGREVGVSVCRLRLLMPMQSAPRRRPLRLIDVVDLDDPLRAAARHARKALIERIGVKHRNDQEHPVSTGHARLGDLHRVEREVPAQQGDIDGRANLCEIVERASEPAHR